jgi:CheY-like chemotaxis protein
LELVRRALDRKSGTSSARVESNRTMSPLPPGAAPPHILVVDDEPCLTSVVQAILEDDGYHVSVANDAQAGLEIARKQRPTLVLSDVKMPGVDGLAFVTQLRGLPSLIDVPVLLFTSFPAEGLARRVGAWGILQKPASREALLRKVFQGVAVGFMVEERRKHNTTK